MQPEQALTVGPLGRTRVGPFGRTGVGPLGRTQRSMSAIRGGTFWPNYGGNHRAVCDNPERKDPELRSRAAPPPAGRVMGTLISDGYSGFDEVIRRNGIVRGGWLAHARRKAKEALDAGDSAAARQLRPMQRLFCIERGRWCMNPHGLASPLGLPRMPRMPLKSATKCNLPGNPPGTSIAPGISSVSTGRSSAYLRRATPVSGRRRM